jgi:hypothetical protein
MPGGFRFELVLTRLSSFGQKWREIPEITTPNGGRPAATSRARARNPATRKHIHRCDRTAYEVDRPIRACSPSHACTPNLGGPIRLVANILFDIPSLLDVPSFCLDTGLHRECSRMCQCR